MSAQFRSNSPLDRSSPDLAVPTVAVPFPQHMPPSPPKILPGRPAQVRGAAVRIILFFALVLGLVYSVDFAINHSLRRIQTSAFGVSNRVMSGEVNAEIVISGSSRALTHYDPRVIYETTGRSAYNIGRNGSQTDMQVAYLKAYLDNNTKPDLLIHNLDLFSFTTSREIYDPAQYLPYLDQEPLYAAIRKIHPHAWKWKYFPLYSYVVEDMRFTWLLGLQRFLGSQPLEDHFQGFQPRLLQWTGDFDNYRADNPTGVKFDIEPAGIADMEDLIATCKNRGIALLFVYSPEYYEMQLMEQNRAQIFAIFLELCDRHAIELWDFSDSRICTSRDNFYNSQHLNARGAALFSTELANRLLSVTSR